MQGLLKKSVREVETPVRQKNDQWNEYTLEFCSSVRLQNLYFWRFGDGVRICNRMSINLHQIATFCTAKVE